ncbi:MAG: hypothetical protein NTX25_02350 [Proteobacteria bacterium]|nr:hypothetical protein [Pseudomonadota bacterium]
MNSQLIVTLTVLSIFGLGCGEAEPVNLRKAVGTSLDATPVVPVSVSFTLPSRANFNLDASTLRSKLNGYAWSLEGQGDKCKDSKIHEASGAYEDSRTFILDLSTDCNYMVKIMLGELNPPKLNLATKINYQQHIQPILNESCTSCHAEFKDYAGVRAQAHSIVSHIENETMPPKAPLEAGAIALFLAWADSDFSEKPEISAVPRVSEGALQKTYYKNNNNDMIMAYELLGRTSYQLRRSLWIQAEGEELGLLTKQLFTFRTTTP